MQKSPKYYIVEAAALPADVERHTYGNWLTVDGEQMYTIRLVDGAGTPLTDEQLTAWTSLWDEVKAAK